MARNFRMNACNMNASNMDNASARKKASSCGASASYLLLILDIALAMSIFVVRLAGVIGIIISLVAVVIYILRRAVDYVYPYKA